MCAPQMASRLQELLHLLPHRLQGIIGYAIAGTNVANVSQLAPATQAGGRQTHKPPSSFTTPAVKQVHKKYFSGYRPGGAPKQRHHSFPRGQRDTKCPRRSRVHGVQKVRPRGNFCRSQPNRCLDIRSPPYASERRAARLPKIPAGPDPGCMPTARQNFSS